MDYAFTKEKTCSVTHVKENGEKCVFILLFFENYLKAIEEQNVFKTTANSVLKNEHFKSKSAYIYTEHFYFSI